jgi:DNA-binding MarR family transcriptional regulator
VRDGHAARLELTGVEYTTLIALHHLKTDGAAGVKQVADHLHVSGSFATTIMGKRIERGLATKQAEPTDGRHVLLNVTQDGHDLLATLAPLQQQVKGCKLLI